MSDESNGQVVRNDAVQDQIVQTLAEAAVKGNLKSATDVAITALAPFVSVVERDDKIILNITGHADGYKARQALEVLGLSLGSPEDKSFRQPDRYTISSDQLATLEDVRRSVNKATDMMKVAVTNALGQHSKAPAQAEGDLLAVAAEFANDMPSRNGNALDPEAVRLSAEISRQLTGGRSR